MIILKVTKEQGFTLSVENTFLEKPQGVGGQIDSLAFLGLIPTFYFISFAQGKNIAMV